MKLQDKVLTDDEDGDIHFPLLTICGMYVLNKS